MQDEHKSWSDSKEEKEFGKEAHCKSIFINFALTCTAVAFKGMLYANIINPTLTPTPPPLLITPCLFQGKSYYASLSSSQGA